MLKINSLGVNIVDNGICIPFLASCENCDFEIFICHFQKFVDVGPYVEFVFPCSTWRQFDVKTNLLSVKCWLFIVIGIWLETVDQGFVQVKNQKFLKLAIWRFFLQINRYLSFFNFRNRYRLHSLYKSERLKDVDGNFSHHWALNSIKNLFLIFILIIFKGWNVLFLLE